GVAVPTFWAVLLNRRPFSGVSALNAGSGAHLDQSVALSRALTEAVQSRLTMIHGARDDIVEKPVYASREAGDPASGPAFRYFDALVANSALRPAAYEGDLDEALAQVLALLRRAGHERVYRVDLRCPLSDIAVVKVIAPELRFRRELF